MRRALKFLGILAVLLVSAGVLLVVLLPTAKIAELAADQVKAATGRELRVSGRISPSFYPVLGVETGAVALANAEWGKAPAIVSAAGVKIGVELLPLLSGEIRVKEISLLDPIVSLEVNEAGKGNWVFDTPPSAAPSSNGGGAGLDGVSIAELGVKNGAFRYSDQRTGAAYGLDGVTASAALPGLDQPLTLEGVADYRNKTLALDLSVSPARAALEGGETKVKISLGSEGFGVNYEGTVTPASVRGRPAIAGVFGVNAKSPGDTLAWATGGDIPPALKGVSDLDISGDVVLTDAAKIAVAGGVKREGQKLNLDLHATGGADWAETQAFAVDLTAAAGELFRVAWKGDIAPGSGPAPLTLKGSYDITATDPAAAMTWATGAADPSLKDISTLALKGDVDLSARGLKATAKGGATRKGQRGFIDVSANSGAEWLTTRAFALKANATLDGLIALDFNGDIAAPEGTAPRVKGALALDAPDLRALAALAGTSLPAGKQGAFRSLKFDGSVSTPGANEIRLEAKRLNFDAINASGTIGASYGGRPSVTANLDTGALDLTPYLGDGSSSSGSSGPGWSKDPIDLSALNGFDADIAVRAKSVTFPQAKLGRSDLKAVVRNGRLDLRVHELGLYGGGVKGAFMLDGKAGNALSADMTIGAVKLLPMLRDIAGMKTLKGLGNLTVKAKGRGASLHDLMRSLDGSGTMKLTDGAIVGYNIAAMVRNVTGGGGAQDTDFSEIGATFGISNGVVTTNDLAFLGPLLRVAGQGSIDLGQQSMNMRLVPKAVATLKGQGGKFEKDGLAFPVIISGPWSNLSFRPDLQAGISNLLSDPDGTVDAVKGLIEGADTDALLKGGADALLKEGGADALLKGGGAAAVGGAALGTLLSGGAKDKPKAAAPKQGMKKKPGMKNRKKGMMGGKKKNAKGKKQMGGMKQKKQEEALKNLLKALPGN